jgi:hypothetical protein
MSACIRRSRYQKGKEGAEYFLSKFLPAFLIQKLNAETLICIDFQQRQIVNFIHSSECFPGCILVIILRTA